MNARPFAPGLVRNMSMAPRQVIDLAPARLVAEAVAFHLAAALERHPSGSPEDDDLIARLRAFRAPADPRGLEVAIDAAAARRGIMGCAILGRRPRAGSDEARTCLDPVLTAIVLTKSGPGIFVAGKPAVVTAGRLGTKLTTREPWLSQLALGGPHE